MIQARTVMIPALFCTQFPNVIIMGAVFTLTTMVTEKNQKIKDTLKIMSLSRFSYAISFLLF